MFRGRAKTLGGPHAARGLRVEDPCTRWYFTLWKRDPVPIKHEAGWNATAGLDAFLNTENFASADILTTKFILLAPCIL
jgi:hypothetical protein